jgi:hypothetical protein
MGMMRHINTKANDADQDFSLKQNIQVSGEPPNCKWCVYRNAMNANTLNNDRESTISSVNTPLIAIQ